MYQYSIEKRTLHFKQPAGTSRGVYTERTVWLVTFSDGHATGIGECAPLPALSIDDVADYDQRLQQFAEQTALTGEIAQEALAPYPSIRFGLETALLSLRSGGRLWDTPFSRGEEGIPINGLIWMGTRDEMATRIKEKVDAGFRCIKLKVGAIDFDSELALVAQLRNMFSPRTLEIRLDANGGFHPDEALYRLELLSQYAIHSIEQPIRAGQWAYMADLCREAPLPIALDEELIGIDDREQKRQMLSIIKPAYIILKPSLHGGISGCDEWREAAAEQGIGSWVTSALESSVGLSAVAQYAAHAYGPDITLPQGLGTGMLFTDNLPARTAIRDQKLWMLQG